MCRSTFRNFVSTLFYVFDDIAFEIIGYIVRIRRSRVVCVPVAAAVCARVKRDDQEVLVVTVKTRILRVPVTRRTTYRIVI